MILRTTTKKQITDLINKYQAEQLRCYALFVAVRAALEPFEGKEISKRLATAVGKALPDHHVYYEKNLSFYQLSIREKKDFETRNTFLLGYITSEFIFHLKETPDVTRGFDHFNQCHELEKGRAEGLEKLKVRIPELVKLAADFKKAKDAIESASEYGKLETCYQLQYLLKGQDTTGRNDRY